MKLEKVKLIIGITIAATTIVGIILGVDRYFAKSADVNTKVIAMEEDHKKLEIKDELAQERLDISISDDHIFQQQQHIQQMKNYSIFEQRKEIPELTSMEKEAMKNAEERLDKLKKEKKDKIKRYEQMRIKED
jgi:hypothetical protein